MLMQVWRHQQGEQLPETPPQRSQTQVQQQQLGGKLMRYVTAWETINCKEFIQKGFYLIFKDNNSQKRFQQTFAQCPFQVNQIEMQAFKAMLEEEIQEDSAKTRAVKTQGWPGHHGAITIAKVAS
ncbi:MAG: hypothetical protein EZS28_019625, partial [Streblomastix strix]